MSDNEITENKQLAINLGAFNPDFDVDITVNFKLKKGGSRQVTNRLENAKIKALNRFLKDEWVGVFNQVNVRVKAPFGNSSDEMEKFATEENNKN